MNKFDRKKFFSLIGSTLLLGSIASSKPMKIIKSVNLSASKKITLRVHPEAVKRTGKV